ncbi:iron chelate uptake ABC transporter family permease subunit [Microbulbifer rhizosphaerae]|uniref:Iron complex transport system permease protein n=1 Tax=Microbulbifer rhizosphaerae TaxID=1562603 RepID=A0A7W4Z790_9GAMM|nr:iron complex transport system permease protein [Microbulbifer rhizosphaerae]
MSDAAELSPARRPWLSFAGLGLLGLVLLFTAFLHLGLGAKALDWTTTWQALSQYDPTNLDHAVVRDSRLARLLVAVVVGAALAVAGVLIQAITDNPLADPGILGINGGAAFFVVAGLLMVPGTDFAYLPWYAFLGAVSAAVIVALLGGRAHNPVRLTLAGAAVAALFSAMTATVLLLDQQGLEKLRHWLTGAIGAADVSKLLQVTPYLVIGLLLALSQVRSLDAHRLGARAAAGLGVNILRLKVVGLVAVVLLSGSVVAVAGPIGFVGLVVPHAVRLVVSADYRWILGYSVIVGALLVVLADLLARVAVRPYEINTGIVTAMIGGPLFIALVIRRVK